MIVWVNKSYLAKNGFFTLYYNDIKDICDIFQPVENCNREKKQLQKELNNYEA